ncbi:MAG TPA: glycosyltransferase family 39 protein [Fulvivirga sp.]|nr:glycosyltransferase family 39 protein [Fulvivirga sp.]
MSDLVDNTKYQISWWRPSWDKNPLQVILLIALVIRVLAAIFSKGYAFHDDHFDVIRVAQDWIDGIPHWIADDIPPNHSMFYVGINATFIYILESLRIVDPQIKMIFIRLVHAFYSLLVVSLIYKITELLSGKEEAKLAGLLTALLWFFPYLGVKNLVEMVCLPPLLAAFYYVLKRPEKLSSWLFAGMLFGLSFVFRYHIMILTGGLGIVILLKGKWRESIAIIVGFLLVVLVIIGIPDVIFWEYPLQSIVAYFDYNANNAFNYSTGPIYRYFLTVMGFTVPPVSVFLLVGFIRSRKVSPELWWAAILFFVVHSLFPNKQERFIIPFFPFFIILGSIGWYQLVKTSSGWWSSKVFLKYSWNLFWLMNVIAGFALAFTYSKKDRIEPLSYLESTADVKSLIVESASSNIKEVPAYYLGKNTSNYEELFWKFTGKAELVKNKGYLADDYRVIFEKSKNESIETLKCELDFVEKVPSHVIMIREENLIERQLALNTLFPDKKMVFEKAITPSLFDKLLHVLNPRVHKDETAFVFRLEPR